MRCDGRNLPRETQNPENIFRFGLFSEAIIKQASKKLHDAGVALSLYNAAREAIGMDSKGYFIQETGTVGAQKLICIASEIEEVRRAELARFIASGIEKVRKADYECDCGWIGTGTGREGALIEGDRCPDCGGLL